MRKQTLPKIMRVGSPDDFQTPPQALNPLLKYLNKNQTIWEPACGKRYLVDYLKEKKYKVIGTDIKEGIEYDFLKYVPTKIDIIITNPPYSLKNEFIERCYNLKKPFALLLPLAGLETIKRQSLWRQGLQLIILNKRLHFETPNNKESHCWFASAWFTNGLNLEKDLIFGDV